MKIIHSRAETRRNLSLPSKINNLKLSFKPKPRKRVRNKKIKNIGLSQLVASLGSSKVSYFDSPCGTIECVEKGSVNSLKELNQNTDSSSISSKHLKNKKFSISKKNRSKNQKSENDCQSFCSSPKNSIVKMTCDTTSNASGNTILKFCSNIRNSGNEGISLLESLILPGCEIPETTVKGANAEKILGWNKLSVSKKSSDNLLSQTVLPSSSSSTNETKIGIVHDTSNSPVCSVVVNSCDKNSAINFYEIGCSKFLVVMKPKCKLAIIGTIEIQLLKGSIEIFGYSAFREDEKLLIFSLLGSSLLSLKAEGCKKSLGDQKSDNSLCEKLMSLGLSEILSRKLSKKGENSVLFTVNRHKTDLSSVVWPKFFETHSSFRVFPNTHLLHNGSRPCHVVERKLNCLFETNLQELGLKEFNVVPEWSAIENDLVHQDYPKVVLCGGKSVGKSSLLRFLVNKCLFKWKQILVLDFDLGQCEFTVPGCISATLVEEPLLGPNYSHLRQPERSLYLGEVDVTKCPENYIEGCKSLVNYAKQKHGDVPWLVNTMGFTKGFGVSLACGIINYVSPSHVVQIQSRDRKLNFPSLLEPKFVDCLKHSAFEVAGNQMDYQLYAIPSGSEQQGFASKSRGISPVESRNLVILSYMSRMLNSNISSLSQVTPYVISMDQIDLLTTNKYSLSKENIAAAMNGSMVALCHKKPLNKFLNCLGFGIVRAVDWQNRTLYLITPLPHTELNKVNCLVKGNVGLPDSLYYNQGDQVTGHVPYLAHTSGGSTARFAKRDFRSLPVSHKDKRQF